jgi:hypothetical protein
VGEAISREGIPPDYPGTLCLSTVPKLDPMLGVIPRADDGAFDLAWNRGVTRNTFDRRRYDCVFGKTGIRKQSDCCEPAISLNHDVVAPFFYHEEAINGAEPMLLDVVCQDGELVPLSCYKRKDRFTLGFDGLVSWVPGVEQQAPDWDYLGLMLRVAHAIEYLRPTGPLSGGFRC